MSQPITIQSAQGECVVVPGVGRMMITVAADPAGGEVGYGPGALWLSYGSGSVWQNTGTEASAVWAKTLVPDANGNIHVNNAESALASWSGAGQTVTLTAASPRCQSVSGSGTWVFDLPDVGTMHAGHSFEFNNNTTQTITVNAFDGTQLQLLAPDSYTTMILNDTASQSDWDGHASPFTLAAVNNVYAGPAAGLPGTTAYPVFRSLVAADIPSTLNAETVDTASTSAFVVTNSSGNTNVLVVDTTNGRVRINATPSSNGLSVAAIAGPNISTSGDGISLAGGAGFSGTASGNTGGTPGGPVLFTPGQGGDGTSTSTGRALAGNAGLCFVVGARGGNASSQAAQRAVGGNGSTWNIAGGNGGTAASITGPATGGTGGTFVFSTGNGGSAVSTGGTTSTGGAGGSWTTTLGAGANASGSTTNNGGAGGDFSLTLGTGGTGSTANGRNGRYAIKGGSGSTVIFQDEFDDVALGVTAPATGATAGFPYIPVMAGAPTGTPQSISGFVPIVFDSTNSKIWIYTGGVWKGVVVT